MGFKASMATKACGAGRAVSGAAATGAAGGEAGASPAATVWAAAAPVGAGAATPVRAGRLAQPTNNAAKMAAQAMMRRTSSIVILLMSCIFQSRGCLSIEDLGLRDGDRLAPPAFITRQRELGPGHVAWAGLRCTDRERHVFAGREVRPMVVPRAPLLTRRASGEAGEREGEDDELPLLLHGVTLPFGVWSMASWPPALGTSAPQMPNSLLGVKPRIFAQFREGRRRRCRRHG